MKKYFLGVVAVALAVGFTAFTMPKHKLTDVIVVFNGDEFTSTEVSNPAQWQVITEPTCSGSNQACKLQVSDAFVTTGAGTHTLKSNVAISVAGSDLAGYRPQTLTDANNNNASISAVISNKN